MLVKTKFFNAFLFAFILFASSCTRYVEFPELTENEGVLSSDEQNIAYSDSQQELVKVAKEKSIEKEQENKIVSKDKAKNAKTIETSNNPKEKDKVIAPEKEVKDLSKPDTTISDVDTVSYVVPSKRTPVVINDMDLIEMDAADTKTKSVKPNVKKSKIVAVKAEKQSIKTPKTEFTPSVFYLAETILFDNGSSSVNSNYNNSLRKIVKEAKSHNGKIVVQGFASSRTKNTDIISHKTANLKVSIARAESVAKLLQRYGMPKSHIITEGLSDSRPLYKEVMPEGERLNRRAEIYITY